MLTPAVTDPNRKAELIRAKQEPAAFGTDVPRITQPNHNALGSGLVADSKAKKTLSGSANKKPAFGQGE